MLTRRHLRIKVMQSLYSFLQNREGSLVDEVNFFKKSYLNTFSLYLSLLAFLKSTFDYAKDHTALERDLRVKASSLNSDKLVQNNILKFIAGHPVLLNYIKKRKIKFWELDFDYVRANFDTLMKSDKYKHYALLKSPTLKEDKDLISYFFKEIVAQSDRFYEYIEDKELTWIDDLPVVNTFLVKILAHIDPDDVNSLSFPEMNIADQDPQFAIELMEKVIVNDDLLTDEMAQRTENWDRDRIALLDAIMIKMAIAELLFFPSIPTKVTLNEYIEISKDYSTPKSNVFINGVLDKIIKDFETSDRLNKAGRGLI